MTTLVVLGAPDRMGDASSARTPAPTVLRDRVDDAAPPTGAPRVDLLAPRRPAVRDTGGPSGPRWKSFG